MSELKGPDVNVEAQDLKYTPERAEQLLQNYRRVLERIRAAEQDRSGVRTEQSAPVRLVTVTKFFPASDAIRKPAVRVHARFLVRAAGALRGYLHRCV